MKKEHVYFFLCKIEDEVRTMAQKGRPQGGKNRNGSKEDKLRIVRRYFYENIGEGFSKRRKYFQRYAPQLDKKIFGAW